MDKIIPLILVGLIFGLFGWVIADSMHISNNSSRFIETSNGRKTFILHDNMTGKDYLVYAGSGMVELKDK